MTMKALDLFCGGGGAAIGLLQAGFDEVVGIDIAPHPNYPGTFIQADIHHMPVDALDFDFVWASPPCQRFSVASRSYYNNGRENKHPDLIGVTRKLLECHPLTCIENVPPAPIRPDVILSGPSVGLLYILRRRHFELSWFMLYPTPHRGLPKDRWLSGEALCVTKSMRSPGHLRRLQLEGLILPDPDRKPYHKTKKAMGIPISHQMTKEEIGESVPPPYSKFIADYVIEHYLNGKGMNV